MGHFTKAEARLAASRVTNTLQKSSNRLIFESASSVKDYESFDIFLSHSIMDSELVLGVKTLLEERGHKVYVDWQYDSELSRENVTKETAAILRQRMRQCKSLVYVATDNATNSKWMPWEIGYFDGLRSTCIAILPLLDDANSAFKGQEYLGLYPLVTKDSYTSGVKDVFVEERGSRWTTFQQFASGSPLWRTYSSL